MTIEKTLKCDVLIIGAGPAGASLAYYLSGKGVGTILIDKRSQPDNPVRCAEYVPAGIRSLYDFPVQGVELATDAMTTYIDYKEANTKKAPGLMLDRRVFILSLINSYRKNGGAFLKSTKAVSFMQEDKTIKTSVVSGGKQKYISSAIVVGTDGPNSMVGRHIGSTNKRFVLGLNENISAEVRDKSRTLIFFSPGITGGYGWLFPKKKSINLGIGCEAPYERVVQELDIKGIFRAFKKKIASMDLIKTDGPGRAIPEGRIAAGLIPSTVMAEDVVKGGFILAGDAAGLSNPITGAGIYNAVYSAEIVFKAICSSLKKKDPGMLVSIKDEYKNAFSLSLKRAAERRRSFLSRWPEDIRTAESFNLLIRDSWVAFRPYWKR